MTEQASSSRIDRVIEEILLNRNQDLGSGNIKQKNFVGWGFNSFVCRNGGEAYKFYWVDRGLDMGLLKKLKFYREATNDAAKLCETKGYKFTSQTGVDYPLRVNPFTEILMSNKYRVIVGVSSFIDGPKLDETDMGGDIGILGFLDQVGGEMVGQLGVAGIKLAEVNIKVVEGALVVTDLCIDITSLRKFGKRKLRY